MDGSFVLPAGCISFALLLNKACCATARSVSGVSVKSVCCFVEWSACICSEFGWRFTCHIQKRSSELCYTDVAVTSISIDVGYVLSPVCFVWETGVVFGFGFLLLVLIFFFLVSTDTGKTDAFLHIWRLAISTKIF